jgi:hypothetical protein
MNPHVFELVFLRFANKATCVLVLLAAMFFSEGSLVVPAFAQTPTGVLLPDGREFVSWEKPLQFTKTYYVDNRNPKTSDSNSGTKELPFLTIDALNLTWSVSGKVPEVPTGKPFERDFLGQPAEKTRKPGPLVQVPAAATTIHIDPRLQAR